MTGEQVKRVTVEEARQKLRRAITVDGFERDLVRFEAAVREDERERAGRVVHFYVERGIRSSDIHLSEEQP